MSSTIQKEIDSILKLAREVKEESIFQQKAQYIKFKSKKNGHRSEIVGLINNMHDLKFSHECIYWCNKLFQERVCNKIEKYKILYILSASYYRIEKYEKTIEFGQKFLDVQPKTQKHFDSSEGRRKLSGDFHRSIILFMIVSSKKLEKEEDLMKYLKEKLKLDILSFNNGQITLLKLLQIYIHLVYVQVQTKNFDFAHKTLKSLKLFSLNSPDPQDVVVLAMEKYGYKKYFPFSLLYIKIDNTEGYNDFTNLAVEHYENFLNLPDQEMRESVEMVEMFRLLARICLYKCEILQEQAGSDRANCEKWAYLHFLISYDIQFHLRLIESVGASPVSSSVDSGGARALPEFVGTEKGTEREIDDEDLRKYTKLKIEIEDSALCETIAAALRLSIYDPLKRAKIFEDVYPAILGREKTIGYYLSKTSSGYCLSFEHLMPFITFCIDKFDDFAIHDKPYWSKVEEGRNSKKKLILYKNSLININHFQTKLQQNLDLDMSENEDIKFQVFHKYNIDYKTESISVNLQ